MSSSDIALAISQVQRVAGLCNFLESPQLQAVRNSYPVTMPPDWGSGGFDLPLWMGLGIVGIWSAMDAFSERVPLASHRCNICRRPCLAERFGHTGKLIPDMISAIRELDDIRHLNAHNFAGLTDAGYATKKRHVIVTGTPVTLSSGAQFNGIQLNLGIGDLRYYSVKAEETLRAFLL